MNAPRRRPLPPTILIDIERHPDRTPCRVALGMAIATFIGVAIGLFCLLHH